MTDSPCRIREAVPEDAPALARIFAAAIEAKARESYGPRERAAWIARGTAQRFAAMLAAPQHRLLVAHAPSGPTGFGGLTGSELSLLYAAPDAAPGTGARLLARLEDLARTSGIPALTLTASRNALSFYLRHGYAIVSPARRDLPGGLSLVVCLMAKTLEGKEEEKNASGGQGETF
jgi:putative acetyltransferase